MGGNWSWVSEMKPVREFKLMLGAGPEHSWKPVKTGNTTSLDYWLNWRFFLCAGSVISSMTIASILIKRYEGVGRQNRAESQQQKEIAVGTVYDDDSWRPCLKHIHPAWLLAFRLTAFIVLSVLLTAYVSIEGMQTFYYYTQWTFAFDIIYFGVGSMLSMYGCRQFCKEVNVIRVGRFGPDEEEQESTYVARVSINMKSSQTSGRSKGGGVLQEECHLYHNTADIWGYLFQIIYQTNAGAVVLTDFIFWVIIVPFLEMKQYNVSPLMIVMHSVNAVFLLGDVAINSLKFPVFRIAYFLLWTGIYVLFQWIVHAFISFWWPYPFLDLSSQYSPLWYLTVAVLHLPCYAIFSLIIKTKHWLLTRCFPYSYLL